LPVAGYEQHLKIFVDTLPPGSFASDEDQILDGVGIADGDDGAADRNELPKGSSGSRGTAA